MSEEIIVGEFEKNSRETVRVRLAEFHGVPILDIRSFYPGPDGEMKPGKGLSIRQELVGDLKRAIGAAEKTIKAQARPPAPDAETD